jgi:hypothetical protein
MAITLLELKTQSRYKADMSESDFVTDAELTTYINSSIAELHDLLVSINGADYFLSSANIVATGLVDSFALPSTFYKLRGVDAKINNNDWCTLKPFNFNERNRATTLNYGSFNNTRYRVQGSKIFFSPLPDANVTFRVWFTPLAEKLDTDSDELSDLNQYAEYVTVDAAIKMLQKEESDVSVLMAQKAQLKRRIEESAQNRDSAEGISVTDVYASDSDYWRYNS